jgi:hypothetical protein
MKDLWFLDWIEAIVIVAILAVIAALIIEVVF